MDSLPGHSLVLAVRCGLRRPASQSCGEIIKQLKLLCGVFFWEEGLSGHHLVGVVLISSIPMKLLWEAWAPGGRLLLRTDGVLLTKDS